MPIGLAPGAFAFGDSGTSVTRTVEVVCAFCMPNVLVGGGVRSDSVARILPRFPIA